jgi:hypothetical protein
MKKLISFTKFLGVVALLCAAQVAFGQKVGGTTLQQGNGGGPTTVAPLVQGDVAKSRVSDKRTQVLGQVKVAAVGSQAYNDGMLRLQFFDYLTVFLNEGFTSEKAISEATRKVVAADGISQNANGRTLLSTVVNEARVLLQ